MKVFDRARNGLYDAKTQVIIVAIVCFLCPGMFNALNSIQGESNEVERIKSLQTAVLYLAFSVFSLLAGGLNNLVGPRALLVFAGSTYSLFVASKFAIHLQDMADKVTNRTTRIDFLETANPMWPLWILGLGLYMSYGVYDAFFQAYTYWLLGSLSHDAAINSRYAGFYKAVQSLFAAISWVLGDKTLHASFPNIFPSMNISPIQMFLITMTPMVASCFCFAVFVKKFVIDIDEEGEWVEYEEE